MEQLLSLLAGVILGGLVSWLIAYVYYRRSSVRPPEWARPLIEHLPKLPPTPERLLQLYRQVLAPEDQWRRVLEASVAQLELLNELDPSQPRAAFGALKARFDSTLAEFRTRKSLDAAVAMTEIAPQLLKKATETYTRPSTEFKRFREDLMAALEEVRAEAQGKVPSGGGGS